MANDISGWGEQWGEQDQQLAAGAFLSQAQRAQAVLGENDALRRPQAAGIFPSAAAPGAKQHKAFVPSIPRFVPASKLLADARSPRIPTIQEVTSSKDEAIGATHDVNKRLQGQKSHWPQSHASAKQRSEAISAAIKAASPRSPIQRPCDLAISNGRLSPRSYERYPKLTSGFQYSVDNARPIIPLSRPPTASSDIGLRVPRRPQSGRPDSSLKLGIGDDCIVASSPRILSTVDHARPIIPLSRPPTASSDIGLRVPRRPQSGRPDSSLKLGIGDDCIVASSPRILSTRSNADSPRSNCAVDGDQFARASDSPRKSPDKIHSSMEQAVTRPEEGRKEEDTQRPSTASKRRATTAPTGQARPSTANAHLNPTPPRTPSPRKVCTPGSGPGARCLQGLTLKIEGETSASDQWITCETHSRFVPVQHRRLQSAKMRAEANDQDDGTIGSESFLTLHLGVLLKEGERDSNERYPANAPESESTVIGAHDTELDKNPWRVLKGTGHRPGPTSPRARPISARPGARSSLKGDQASSYMSAVPVIGMTRHPEGHETRTGASTRAMWMEKGECVNRKQDPLPAAATNVPAQSLNAYLANMKSRQPVLTKDHVLICQNASPRAVDIEIIKAAQDSAVEVTMTKFSWTPHGCSSPRPFTGGSNGRPQQDQRPSTAPQPLPPQQLQRMISSQSSGSLNSWQISLFHGVPVPMSLFQSKRYDPEQRQEAQADKKAQKKNVLPPKPRRGLAPVPSL